MLGLSVAALLAGCATPPMGPSVAVMPAPNKPFEVFAQDQSICKQYASQQVAGGADQANSRGFGTALLTTVLGAGLGAAVGGGRGAAIGAASGAVVGTAVGANTSQGAQYTLQQRYDMAYAQCMATKGDRVPGARHPHRFPPPDAYPPPPGAYPPPPP